MLTQFEKVALKRFGDAYAGKVVDAIKNKKVERYTNFKGNFSAVVNTTGRLANSVNVKADGDEVGVYALEYIQYLVYGRPPSKKWPPVDKIGGWISNKGLGLNKWATSNNIRLRGSSIWQRWKGQNSGLLDFDYSAEYSQLTAEIMRGFGNLVVLDIKELEDDFR